MGSFYAYDFMFDSVPSQTYNVKISYFSQSDPYGSPAGSDVEIIEKYVPRRYKPYEFGIKYPKMLEFDVEFTSADDITALDRNVIEKWLLGRSSFLPLQIIQDDLTATTYNVIFTGATNQYVGNTQKGMVLHARCDSPWAWGNPGYISRTYGGNNIVTDNFTLYNYSAHRDYVYPKITFTLNTVGNMFQITNFSDNNRVFSFTALSPNETITVDNDLQILQSSTGLFRMGNFNKNWLRLRDGKNSLNVYSGIGTFTITYDIAKKVGG